ncbi:hypothetical protein D3C78_1746130 [compost metagenome]
MHTVKHIAFGDHGESDVQRSRKHWGNGRRKIRGRRRPTLTGLGTLLSHGQCLGFHPVRQQSPDQAPMPTGPEVFCLPENYYRSGTSKPYPSRPCGHQKPE